MIICENCIFYQVSDSTCHIDVFSLMGIRHYRDTKVLFDELWPTVKRDDWCGRAVEIPPTPPIGGNDYFTDDFESGWFVVHTPFNLIGYENYEMGWTPGDFGNPILVDGFEINWFTQNNFGSPLFVEDFEGIWV